MEQPEPHAPNAAAAKSDHAFAPLSDSAMPLLIVWDTFESSFLPFFYELCAKIFGVCGTPMTHVAASPPPQPRRSIRIRSASSSPKVRQCLCENQGLAYLLPHCTRVVGVVLLCCMCAAIGNLSASRHIKRIKDPGGEPTSSPSDSSLKVCASAGISLIDGRGGLHDCNVKVRALPEMLDGLGMK